MTSLKNVKQAAALLGISPWTVRAYIRDGELIPVRIGRRVLLEEEELERFIAQAKVSDGNQLDHEAPVAACASVSHEVDLEGGDRA
jgi:excisionase family DNA binding protein